MGSSIKVVCCGGAPTASIFFCGVSLLPGVAMEYFGHLAMFTPPPQPPKVCSERPLQLALAKFGTPMPSTAVEVMVQHTSQDSKCCLSNDEDAEAFVHVLTMEPPFGLHWPSEDCPNLTSTVDEIVAPVLPDDCDIESNNNRTLARKSKRLCKVKRQRLNELAQRLISMEDVELPPYLQNNKFVMNKLLNR